MDNDDCIRYIKDKGTFSLPELQAEFGLTYARAKKIADGLEQLGALSLCDDKITYKYAEPPRPEPADAPRLSGVRRFPVSQNRNTVDMSEYFRRGMPSPYDTDDDDDDDDFDFDVDDDDDDDDDGIEDVSPQYKITYGNRYSEIDESLEQTRRMIAEIEESLRREVYLDNCVDVATWESKADGDKYAVVAVRAADDMLPHECALAAAAIGKTLQEVRALSAELPAVVLDGVTLDVARRTAARLERARVTAAIVKSYEKRPVSVDGIFEAVMMAAITFGNGGTLAGAAANMEFMLANARLANAPAKVIEQYERVKSELADMSDEEYNMLRELYTTD